MTFVLHHLIEASVGAAILVPLILLARRFCRVRVGSRTIYAAWLLVALRLMLPISLPNPLLGMKSAPDGWSAPPAPRAPQAVWQAPHTQAGVTAAAQPLEEIDAFTSGARQQENAELAPEPIAPSSPLSARRAAMAVYLAGAVLAAGIVAAMNVRFRVRLARARVGLLDGEGRAAYEALCRENGVRPLPVWLCDPLPSACLVGVSRPFIALPLTVKRADLRLTLLHELSHAKAGDALWSLVRSACLVLFWFHPLVWLGAHASRLDAEMACDERVAKSLGDAERISYAEMLVRMAVRRGVPALGVLATGMSMNGGRMRARVRGIVQSRAVRRRAIAAAMLLGAALLTLTFATAEAPQMDAPDAGGSPTGADEAAWRAVDADVLTALGFPADAIRVCPGACEVAYSSLSQVWTASYIDVESNRQVARELDAAQTVRYDASGPWNLRLDRADGGEAYTLTVDETGDVLSFAYESQGWGEVVRTEAGIPQEEGRAATYQMPLSTSLEIDTELGRLVEAATGMDGEAVTINASAYAAVYADGTRVRKAVARTKDAADLWLLSVQCEPLRILSMVYKPGEPMLSEYVTVEPTQAEALAGVKTYLLEAGWTQAEIDAPTVSREDENTTAHFYGESAQGSRDGWYVRYDLTYRQGLDLWRGDMRTDAAERRPIAQDERERVAQAARTFVQRTRLGSYGLEISAVEVEDAIQIYPDGEVARVWVRYDDAYALHADELRIRLEPQAVLQMRYTYESVPLTQEQIAQSARRYLAEEAGLAADAPIVTVRQAEQALYAYGETAAGARDLWTVRFDVAGRDVSAFWTADEDLTGGGEARSRALAPEEKNAVTERAWLFVYGRRGSAIQRLTVSESASLVNGRELVDTYVLYRDGAVDWLSIALKDEAVHAWTPLEETDARYAQAAEALALADAPDADDEAAWRTVDADVISALGFPADEIRVRPGVCEASYGSLGTEWTVLATAPQARFAEGTMRFEMPGPWTLSLEHTAGGASYALTVNELGGVEGYLYEPVRGGLGEVVRTEPVEGIFTPKDLRDTGTLAYTTWQETDQAPSRLIRQALGVGTDEAVYGSVYAEVYADGTRVRKYAVRPAHAESWVFRVRMEPLCILSAQYFPEGSGEADFSVLETPEEAEASIKDYLARAGWTPAEIDMPLVRTDDGGIYYGETDRNAQDGWYVSYHASRRYVDSFWRADMQKDAQAQRPLTEGERAWAIEKAKAFLQENRLGTYDLTIGEVAVDDAVQRYPDGEVVRVRVNYADKNYVRTDALCIRLEPEAVLKMDYTWVKIDPQDGRGTSQAARIEDDGRDEEEKEAPTPQVEEAFLSYLDAVMRVDGYAYTDRSVSPERDGWTMRGQDGRKSFEIHMNAQGNVDYAAWSDGEALTGTEQAQDMEWTWTDEQKRLVAVLEPRGPGNERCEWQQEIQVYPSRRTRDARIWWESTALGYVVTLDADTHRVVGIQAADAAQLGLEARASYDEAAARRAGSAYQQVSGGSCGAANECDAEVEREGDRFYHRLVDRETGAAFALLEMDAETYRPLSLRDLRAQADEAASLDETLYTAAITIAEDHLMRQYLYGLELQITSSRVMDARKREASLDFYTLPLQNKATMEALRQEATKQAAGEACIEAEVQIDVSDGRTFQLRVDARHDGVFACYERTEP